MGGVITGCGRENDWPLVFQFWFLRDLIVLEITSPILDSLLKKNSLFLMVLELILLCLNKNVSVLSIISIFSYTLGTLCGKKRVNFFDFSDSFSIGQIFLSFFIIVILKNILSEQILFMQVFNICVIFLSAILILRCSEYFITNNNYFLVMKKLSVFSFFLYAFHAPVFEISLNKLTYKFFFSIPYVGYLLQYIFSPIVTIFLGILIGVFLKRYLPFVFAILNGKR